MRTVVSDSAAQSNAAALACEPWCSSTPCSELNGDVVTECGACHSSLACNPSSADFRLQDKIKLLDDDDCLPADASDDAIGRCDLEVVDSEDVTREWVLNRSEPILIRGATRGWLALERWTNQSEMLARYSAETFEADGSEGTELPAGNATFAELLSWRGGRRRHLLATGRCHYERRDRAAPAAAYPNPWDASRPTFMRAIANDFAVPDYFRPAATFQLSWGSGAGAGVPPENHPSAWFASVAGRKRWILTPPSSVGGNPLPQFSSRRTRAPTDDRRRGERSGHESSMCRPRCKTRRPSLQCDVPVGDILWFPNFWYHETCGHDAFSAGIGGVTFRECCQRQTARGADGDLSTSGMWVVYTGYQSHLVFEAHISGDTSVMPGGGARLPTDVSP